MHHAYIDRYSQNDSFVHRLDPRAKLGAALAYSVALISFGRYEVAALLPMLVLPLAWLEAGGVPLWFALRRVAVLSPLILMLALAGVFYDRVPQAVSLGPWRWSVAGGWLTAADIALKFAMGLLALTALICTTRFSLLLEGMNRLRLPRLLILELSFLYRYIFVLIDEAMRVRRARDFRGAALAPMGRRLAAVGGVIGSLFVRTMERSTRIQLAMAARGFTGQVHSLGRLKPTWRDAAMLAAVAVYLLVCRGILA